MRFWDSSALVPLLVLEEASAAAESATLEDAAITTWWGTTLECASAVGRRERDGSLSVEDAERARRKLAVVEAHWSEVVPSDRLRETARRLLRVHDLRAGDALQLAAAVTASATHDAPLPFVTLDERLALAASREGFPVLGLD
ncbi:MAG: type II toxin-antitoxin system VapC family toxin [Thermoleophilia bacterium]|nr:type II toxin-antitoxin system VapC family toxin [Thermoleophilia bacterium]